MTILDHRGQDTRETPTHIGLVMQKLSGKPADGATPINERQLKRELAQNATVEDVVDIAHLKAVQMTTLLGNQIPPLVAQMMQGMVAEAMAGLVAMLEERYVLTLREQSPEEAPA